MEPPTNISRLAEFSEAVRDSSLRRFALVPEGYENWRPAASAMSFADILQHLVDCDQWLFTKIKSPELKSIRGTAGCSEGTTRNGYLRMMQELRDTGASRKELINSLSERDVSRKIFDDRFDKEVEVWWVIVRGNLDHETHHRGQVAAYLRNVNENLKHT